MSAFVKIWDWLTQLPCEGGSPIMFFSRLAGVIVFSEVISMFNQKANMCIIALLVFKPFSHYRY